MTSDAGNRGPRRPSPEGFKAVYHAEVSYVWRYLVYMGVPDRDLEDKVQDVFVALYRCWDSYDASRPMRPWLTGICFRVASDHRRKAYNRREVIRRPVEAVDPGQDPEEGAARREAAALIHEALEQMTPDHRTVFVLHDIEGLPVPAITRGLGLPVNTLYSRLRHARRQFMAAVDRIIKGRRRRT